MTKTNVQKRVMISYLIPPFFGLLQLFSISLALLGSDRCPNLVYERNGELIKKPNGSSGSSEAIPHCRNFGFLHPKFCFEQSLQKLALEIARQKPSLIMGPGNLFRFDADTRSIKLTLPFKRLLSKLLACGELDPAILKAHSLNELDTVLQKPQGLFGGLMRARGSERWELSDSALMVDESALFFQLFQELGFSLEKCIENPISVDHCIVFGARAERMKTRIEQTLEALITNVNVTGDIFCLGSSRPLLEDEIAYLSMMCKSLGKNTRNLSKKSFAQQANWTETKAMKVLWRLLSEKKRAKALGARVVFINSTKIRKKEQRVTTADTLVDWLQQQNAQSHSFFCLVEQPFHRLADQLCWAVLRDQYKGKKNLLKGISTIHLHRQFQAISPLCSMRVVLDEIARNVHLVNQTNHFCDNLG